MRILLVDDHHDTVTVMARLFAREGFVVSAASTRAEAQELCRTQGPFDLVVCDASLPDGDGIELAREIKARYHIDAIGLSGYGEPESVQRGIDAGMRAYLVKPVAFDKLLEAVRSTLPAGSDERHSSIETTSSSSQT